tara:strand:- start:59614 stop:59913 length:300 start_codon:yes stop_codon:yes gene_type:complete
MLKKYPEKYNYNFDLIRNNETNDILLVIFKNKLNKKELNFKIENNSLFIQDKKNYIEFNDLPDNILNEFKDKDNINIIEINDENLNEDPLFIELKNIKA